MRNIKLVIAKLHKLAEDSSFDDYPIATPEQVAENLRRKEISGSK